MRSPTSWPRECHAWGLATGLFAIAGLWGAGCTVEPVGAGLWVRAPNNMTRICGEDSTARELLRRNDEATQAALQGDFDSGLRLMPNAGDTRANRSRVLLEDSESALSTLIDQNRDTIAYWRQRRAFVGMGVTPDEWLQYQGTGSMAVSGGSGKVVENALDAEFAGLGVRVPALTIVDRGHTTSFIGDTEVRVSAFIGQASTWPDTKLALGLKGLIPTGRTDLGYGLAYVSPFVRVGSIFGPLALTVSADSTGTRNPVTNAHGVIVGYAIVANVLRIPHVVPFVRIEAQTIIGADRDGDSSFTLRPGAWFLIDSLDDVRIGANASLARLYDPASAWTAGGGLTLAYRY